LQLHWCSAGMVGEQLFAPMMVRWGAVLVRFCATEKRFVTLESSGRARATLVVAPTKFLWTRVASVISNPRVHIRECHISEQITNH
jgi:hypothetical protein